MKVLQIILLSIVALILVRCAQPRALNGGTKDTTSPQIIQSSPKNLSTGFDGHVFAMEFDEYIQIKSLNAELVVSPPLSYPIEYKIKGKRVFFEIKDTLKSNTTYNFNFGNAIVDLNEGIPLDSNLYVISTGTSLDSGQVSGTVKNAYTLQPVKNATVILHNVANDSAIYNGNPSYITKTNDQGFYQLKYLAPTSYQIFVLEHPGSDYKYQAQTNIGFHHKNINPSADNEIDFVVFTEQDTAQFLSKDFSRDYFSFVLGFHSALKKPKFKIQPDSANYIIEEIKQDSFKFWIEGDKDLDSVRVIIQDDLGFLDTVDINIQDRKTFYKKLKKKKRTKIPLNIRLNTKNNVLHYFDTLRLNFGRPPSKWNTDSMLFVHGTDTLPINTLFKKEQLIMELPTRKRGSSKGLKSMDIQYKWEPNQEYAFIFYSGAFTDIIKQTNDTTILRFKTNKFEDYGSFKFTVNVPDYKGPLLLELLDKDNKFIRNYEIKSGDVIFHDLAIPGKYKIRLVLDENNNKEWDTGNLDQQTQPEQIIYYDGIIEIRSNWDMEETWNVEIN
jgi:hypothetical protein